MRQIREGNELEEARVQRLVERILKNNRTVDTESLCIQAGELVWSIRIDVKVLDHSDGNAIDTSVAAAIAALSDYRRPDTTINEEGKATIHSTFERHPIPLALHNPPIAVTFAVLDMQTEGMPDHATKQASKMILVADSMILEEELGGALTVALNRHGEIVTIVKSGGDAIPLSLVVDDALVLARSRACSLLDAIQSAIVRARSNK